MIVIASYCALFAVMVYSIQALASESLVIVASLGALSAGYKRSLWPVVVTLAAHGAFDLFHGQLIDNPGVPSWWPHFCLAYDVIAAVYLTWLLSGSTVGAAAT
jgi:hypothetical protein